MSYESQKVLVVDDSSVMRQIIKKSLKELGFVKIDDAEDGTKALKKVSEGEFDLILSDWNMPNMTGLDFLKAVRADGNFKKIPFIMITSEADKEKIMEAIKEGVSQYIVKPFTAIQLEEKIKAIK